MDEWTKSDDEADEQQTVEYFEVEFEQLVETSDHTQQHSDVVAKEESDAIDEFIHGEEIPPRWQNKRYHFTSDREILQKYLSPTTYCPRYRRNQPIKDQSVTEKVFSVSPTLYRASHKVNQSTKNQPPPCVHKSERPFRAVVDRYINKSQQLAFATTTKDQHAANATHKKKKKDLSIPLVVREVRSWTTARSLQTSEEERKFKCPVCGAGFKDKHVMFYHLRRHTDRKDHKCPECDKRFFTATEVRLHMRSHKDERPFLCNICGRTFVSNSHLSEHLKRHRNERNYKCEICEKAFFCKTQLKNHMAGHSSERPFSCDICPSAFSRRVALNNHMKLHENKREFKCKLCEARFNQQAGLFSHTKAVHKSD